MTGVKNGRNGVSMGVDVMGTGGGVFAQLNHSNDKTSYSCILAEYKHPAAARQTGCFLSVEGVFQM